VVSIATLEEKLKEKKVDLPPMRVWPSGRVRM
jgi:hypothetical protein